MIPITRDLFFRCVNQEGIRGQCEHWFWDLTLRTWMSVWQFFEMHRTLVVFSFVLGSLFVAIWARVKLTPLISIAPLSSSMCRVHSFLNHNLCLIIRASWERKNKVVLTLRIICKHRNDTHAHSSEASEVQENRRKITIVHNNRMWRGKMVEFTSFHSPFLSSAACRSEQRARRVKYFWSEFIFVRMNSE